MLRKPFEHKNLLYVFITDCLIRLLLINGFFPHFQTLWLSRISYLYIPWTLSVIVYDLVQHKFVLDRFTKLLSGYFLLAAAATFLNGVYAVTAMHHLSNFLMMSYVIFTIPALYSQTETEQILHRVMKALVYAVLLINILSLLTVLLFRCGLMTSFWPYMNAEDFFLSRSHGLRVRISGYYASPTTGANFGCMASVFALYLGEQKKLTLPAVIGVIGTTLVLMPLFDCRTAIFCMGVLGVSAAWRYLKGKGWKRTANLMVLVCLLTAIVTACFWQVPKLQSYIAEYGPEIGVQKYSGGRIRFLQGAWAGFKVKPLLGWGFVQRPSAEVALTAGQNCHNLILNLVQWSGLSGLAVFGVFLIYSVQNLKQKMNNLITAGDFWLVIFLLNSFLWSMLNIGIIGTQTEKTAMFWLILGFLLRKVADKVQKSNGA